MNDLAAIGTFLAQVTGSVSKLKMKRDPSVIFSIWFAIINILLSIVLNDRFPPSEEKGVYFLFWLLCVVLVVVRFTILWFQTLRHSVNNEMKKERFSWVLGHLFLGPVVSVLYYLMSVQETKKRQEMVKHSQ